MAQVLITNHFSGGMMLLAMAVHQTPAMSWPKALLNFQRLVLGSLYATRIVWGGPMSAACLLHSLQPRSRAGQQEAAAQGRGTCRRGSTQPWDVSSVACLLEARVC